jgi:hypothetical protein
LTLSWLVPGQVTTRNGMLSQVLRSKDHDWPNDRLNRNLVVRLDRTAATPEPAPLARPAIAPAIRVSTGSVEEQQRARHVRIGASDAP